jgi:hypothetical protein
MPPARSRAGPGAAQGAGWRNDYVEGKLVILTIAFEWQIS